MHTRYKLIATKPDTILAKDVSVSVNIDKARLALIAAGYDTDKIDNLTNEKIADLTIAQMQDFGIRILPF